MITLLVRFLVIGIASQFFGYTAAALITIWTLCNFYPYKSIPRTIIWYGIPIAGVWLFGGGFFIPLVLSVFTFTSNGRRL